MKKIYIDSDCCCHTSNLDGTFREVETDKFDGKCDAFIEGYRYVPAGETWTREDGVLFGGEMISPRKPFSELDAAQMVHDRGILAEYESLINELYSEVTAG